MNRFSTKCSESYGSVMVAIVTW